MKYRKKEVRDSVKNKLGVIKDRTRKENIVRKKLLELIGDSKTVFCYISKDVEMDTRNFLKNTTSNIAVPRVEGNKIFAMYIEDFDSKNLKDKYNDIPQPEADKSLILQVKDIDTVIVPGLAFSKKGERVGYGGGYYDKFLQHFRGNKVGICFESQLFDKLPQDEWDVKMDRIITDKRNMET